MPRPVYADNLSLLEKHGRQIYFTGESLSDGSIEATFGHQEVAIPGNLAVCSSCHGYDGLGRPESGIEPTNITWKHLSKSFGHIHDHFQHAPFTDDSLKTFLRSGIFPGGAQADLSMPRYRMPESDLDALVAYLKRLGALQDPGISSDQIRIGSVFYEEGGRTTRSALLDTLLQRYFEKINQSGGLFGRKLSFVSFPLKRGDEHVMALKDWLVKNDLFVLLGPYLPGAEVPFFDVVTSLDIPVVGPYTVYPQLDFQKNRKTFSLLPGLYHQLRALQAYIVQQKIEPSPKVGLLHEQAADIEQVARKLNEDWRNSDWMPIKTALIPEGAQEESLEKIVKELQQSGVNVIVYAGFESNLLRLMALVSESNWSPVFLVSGSLAGNALMTVPEKLAAGFFIAYPTLMRDRLAPAVSKLGELVNLQEVGPQEIQPLISAYVSAELFVHCLKNNGRDLDRRKLISALEKTYRFNAGLMPPLTYTLNRRVGTDGIYVVRPNKNQRDDGEKISVEWFQPPTL